MNHPIEPKRIDFNHMVQNLFKREKFADAYAPLMHAAIGAIGEVTELLFSKNMANTVEELGDAEFYLEAAIQSLDHLSAHSATMTIRSIADLEKKRFVQQQFPSWKNWAMEALDQCETILDLSKKLWVYNRPFDIEMTCALARAIGRAQVSLEYHAHTAGTNRALVLAANQEKLIYGANARYRDMVYSDSAAIMRADKVGTAEENEKQTEFKFNEGN